MSESDSKIDFPNALAPVIWLGAAALVVVILVAGRDILIPLAIAVMLWYLLNAISHGLGRIPLGNARLPRWLTLIVAVGILGGLLAVLVNLVSDSIAAVAAAAPGYQANLERLMDQTWDMLGLTEAPDLSQVLEQFDLGSLISRFAATVAVVASSAGLIIIYIIFLLFEQRSFERKMVALFPDPIRKREVEAMLSRMQDKIQTYVAVKTATSILTGGVSYLILASVGVDYAGFLAVVIFLLNYIPTIGSLLGIIFPALLTLVQFETFMPFFIVTGLVAVAQISIGNLLEPRLMGASLNVSPLVVILSLITWGTIWGIAGMFLSVPIMVILMIILSHFPRTRPVAILLSGDGEFS